MMQPKAMFDEVVRGVRGQARSLWAMGSPTDRQGEQGDNQLAVRMMVGI